MRRLPKRDPLGALHREAISERQLGEQKECTSCGEGRALALERKSHPRLCTECRKESEGKTALEDHHMAGRANSDATIPVPANDHRAVLSEDQKDWPSETLGNPDGSPLLIAAACIRGFIDTILYLVEELLLWIADLLETLNRHMVEQHGPKWWLNTEVEKFARRKRKPNVNP
jgi:hypothetical protein